MRADIFLTDFGIRTDYIKIADYSILNLCASFDHIAVTDLGVQDITLDTKNIIAAYAHDVILFGSRFEHDDCALFYDIVVTEDNFELFLLLLANDRTSWVYYAALPEDNVAYHLIQTQIQHVGLLYTLLLHPIIYSTISNFQKEIRRNQINKTSTWQFVENYMIQEYEQIEQYKQLQDQQNCINCIYLINIIQSNTSYKLDMQQQQQFSSSTILFLKRFKDFLQQNHMTIAQLIANFQMNNNQLSNVQLQNIISVIHIQPSPSFKPHLVFQQLSMKNEAINIVQMKNLILKVNTLLVKKQQKYQQINEYSLIKKLFQNLQRFINQIPNPLQFIELFDFDGNSSINKGQLNKLIICTDFQQFRNQENRRILIQYLFQNFPKGEISVKQLYDLFQAPPKNRIIPVENKQTQISPKAIKKLVVNQLNDLNGFKKHFPLSMKYYRLGKPQPDQIKILQQFEEILRKNDKYIDKNIPINHIGNYVSAKDIFKGNYHIFLMAPSVALRQQSRVGIAQQIQPKDIIQGQIGDCYFLGTIASIISKHPQIIQQHFLININPANYYAVRLFIDGQWKIITTDDRFSCNGNRPVYASPHGNQIWVMLLEKCWAKEFGSYEAIKSGFHDQGFVALTGAPYEEIFQEDQQNQQYVLKQLQVAYQKHYVASTSGSNILKSLKADRQQQLGLISFHAYSLLKIIKVNGQTLVRLRNPWGQKVWKGDWSFESNKWTKQLRNKYRYNIDPKDGSFYMNWKDYRKYFGYVQICKLDPTYVHDSIRAKTNKKKSGYFEMKINSAGQYFLSIYQVSKRKMSQKYSNYTYSPARLIILRKQGNKLKYVSSKLTSQSHVCTVEMQLERGQYVISAKVFWKFSHESQMVLTSYGPNHIFLAPINRSIATNFKQSMIQSYVTIYAGTGKTHSLFSQPGYQATFESNFRGNSGLGYVRLVNNSNKNFKLTQYDDGVRGLKLIKPYKFPIQFDMKPKTEKYYGFIVDLGYHWQIKQKVQHF